MRNATAAAASVACAVILMAGAQGQSPPSASEDLPARLASGPAPRASIGTQQDAPSDKAALVDLQRQVNDLRSDLLDERERQISRRRGANGAVLVVLGVMIGVGGLWAYAKLRSIAHEASIGAAAARHYVRVPQGPLPEAKAPPELPGEGRGPLRLLVSADPESAPAAAPRGEAVASASLPPAGPAAIAAPASLGRDPDELQRLEEAFADCSEAIRLDPRNPALYVERGDARSALGRFEEAIADYDRAIRLDPGNVPAYLRRCQANSDLGRHEEAIKDYERLASLDPDSAGEVAEP